MALSTHWTTDIDAFVFAIGADFMLQLEKVIQAEGTKQAELAAELGVSPGRVSQVLNTPGNLTLRKVVQYARAVGRKVSLVIYDDGDSKEQRGPIRGEILTACWEHVGKPFDNFDLHDSMAVAATADFIMTIHAVPDQYGPNYHRRRSATPPHRSDSMGLVGPFDMTANNAASTPISRGV